MTTSSETRRRRLKKAVRMCKKFCEKHEISAGCANGEHGRLCGPSNCEVYRAMLRGENLS